MLFTALCNLYSRSSFRFVSARVYADLVQSCHTSTIGTFLSSTIGEYKTPGGLQPRKKNFTPSCEHKTIEGISEQNKKHIQYVLWSSPPFDKGETTHVYLLHTNALKSGRTTTGITATMAENDSIMMTDTHHYSVERLRD